MPGFLFLRELYDDMLSNMVWRKKRLAELLSDVGWSRQGGRKLNDKANRKVYYTARAFVAKQLTKSLVIR
jgi:hypothetical protein